MCLLGLYDSLNNNKHVKHNIICIYKCCEITQKIPKFASTARVTIKKSVSSERVNDVKCFCSAPEQMTVL